MKKALKRYGFAIFCSVGLLVLLLVSPSHGEKAAGVTLYSLREMLLIVPPIFVLLGILDVWIPRETMIRFMGPGSGVRGTVISFIVGSAAAGPLYGAFPVAALFIRKGVSLFNVYVFIGAWSTTRIPMFLFELSNLGPRFALARLAVDIPGILIIAWLLTRSIGTSGAAGIERTLMSREE